VGCFNLRINFFSNQNPHTPSSPPYNTNALYLQNPLSLHSTTNSNRFLSLSVTVAVAVSLSVSTVAVDPPDRGDNSNYNSSVE
jgi:hypothetical protein